MMNQLAGKTVLITGASRGIGAYIARALAAAQMTVVGVARSQAALDHLCADIETQRGHSIGIAWDLSCTETLPQLIQQIYAQVGSIDVLINNAAFEKYAAFSEYSSGDLQRILSTNLLAAMELSRLLLPDMQQRQQGHILNIASLAGKKGAPYNSIYSASKAGLIMWSDALRQELTGSGLHVSVICPGYVSEAGMTADTQVPIPILAGKSTPERVAAAVMQVLQRPKAEVIVNQNSITEHLTKLLFATQEFSPGLSDGLYRWLGITQLNQKRVAQVAPNFPMLSKEPP